MPVYPCNKAEVEKHLLKFNGIKPEGIVYDTIHMMVENFEHYRYSIRSEMLALYPASEMYIQKGFTVEPDWMNIWNTARAKLLSKTTACLATTQNGPFVALKKDPIWRTLSRFKRPYPPFEFGSGVRVISADNTLAKSLGVLK